MSRAMKLHEERTELYRKERQEGFVAASVRQYDLDGAGKNLQLETWMLTPYQYQGRPVMGYAVTNLSEPERSSHTMEFWQNGRNIEDIAALCEKSLELTDAQGQTVDYEAARQRMGAFASAASEYPHVFTYDEYVKAKTPINERLHLAPPDANAYQTYLQSVEQQLLSRDIHFVGEITTPAELEEANLCPAVPLQASNQPTPKDEFGF